MDLNAHVLGAVNSAIEEKVLQTFQKALKSPNADGPHKSKIDQRAQKCNPRSDEEHQNKISMMSQKFDPQSDRPQLSEMAEKNRETLADFPKSYSSKSNRNYHSKESSVDSYESEDGYDMVTGAKHTPQMVPEFLDGPCNLKHTRRNIHYFPMMMMITILTQCSQCQRCQRLPLQLTLYIGSQKC